MENRKVKLSKQLLKQSLLELLEEKSLHQISVRELCARADLNRSTFYAHYEDINYLINDIENDILSDTPFMDYTKKKTQKDIVEFSKFIERNYKTIILLIKNGKLIKRIVDSSIEIFLNEGPKTEKELEVFTTLSYFCIGGMFQTLLYKNNLTHHEVSEIIYPLFIEAENLRKKV